MSMSRPFTCILEHAIEAINDVNFTEDGLQLLLYEISIVELGAHSLYFTVHIFFSRTRAQLYYGPLLVPASLPCA